MCVHRKGDNMRSMIEFIYENLQENNLIQKGRKESQQIVEQIVDCVMAKEKITREDFTVRCSRRLWASAVTPIKRSNRVKTINLFI